ncbi:MAG: hypothetical protein Q9225_000689 [Loekoesia sp. 1 TL-2023]
MDSEDGQIFVKNLAQFVRTHEKALANALQLRRLNNRTGENVPQDAATSSHPPVATASAKPSSISNALASALSLSSLSFTTHNVKPAKLTLTSHHLFYLLSRFEEVGIAIGPLNVRTENLHAETSPANYVSFLSQSQRSHGRNDRDSIHSVTSVRSVISGMSTLWSGFGSSNSVPRTEKAQAQLILDLKYLYSAFTKIPCLRLAPDPKARLIRGYEEFPFDTAVPLHAFKNLSALEICDVDFRHFFGWDRLSEQLRSLTLKRANIDSPGDLLTAIVLDDMDKRRRRSSKAQCSPILAWSLTPPMRFADAAKVYSTPNSPVVEDTSGQSTSPQSDCISAAQNPNSSPNRPASSRQNASFRHVRNNSTKVRRSGSGSSDSSVQSNPPPMGAYRTGSSSELLLVGTLPSSKWCFLRHLSLADNSLTSISSNSFTPLADSLHSLDLSSNLFTEAPDGLARLIGLRALNLSNCMIGSLQSLIRNPLPAITALNMRANRLNSIVGVERLLSLEQLDLRENRLRDPSELARLTGLPDFREVWVAQNPFTTSHKNYRTTIFNLFRNTPGLIEDIVIDASGPTYSERKQLIDRVAEGEPVCVVRKLCPETQIHPSALTSVCQDETLQHDPLFGAHGTNASYLDPNSDHTPKPTMAHFTSSKAISRATTKSGRSRKGVRRQRLVDLTATKDLPPDTEPSSSQPTLVIQEPKAPSVESPAESNLVNSVSPSDRPRLVIQAPSDDTVDASHIRALSTSVLGTHEALSSDDSQGTRLKAQAYRQKIEALKQEVGSNWLSALTEEGWTSDRREDVGNTGVSPMHGVRTEFSLLHAQNQGVT